MLQLDVLSSFAICGAGALVSAAMLRPSTAGDEASAEVLRVGRVGYGLIGVGLLHPVLLELPPPLWSQAVMAFGALGGVLIVGGALMVLAGARVTRGALGAVLAVVAVGLLGALPLGTRGLTWYSTLGLAGVSLVSAWIARGVLLHPRDVHERLVGVAIVMMVLSSALRASYLFTWQGAYPWHHVYVPPMMVTPFTVFYGVMPIVFAMLLANVMNARLLARLHQRAMTDHLTGVPTRQALAEGAAALLARLRGGQTQLAVLMIDLDRFKSINDQHGHAGGDAVLRHAAQLLRTALRADAMLARFGGEEFVALVPVPDLRVARRVAERMRAALEQAPWRDVVPALAPVTASLGVTMVAPDESLEQALARADEAMYRAKHGGRNQVQVALAAA